MKKGIFLLLCLSLQLGLIAQNPGWILPPLYKQNMGDFDPPIPLPKVSPTEFGYHGDEATTVSNSMQDANDDLLFFIVDGEIYDKDGYTIGIFDFHINSYLNTRGTAEICIVPVPGNCSQFYIFLSGRVNYLSYSSKEPVVALLDLSKLTNISLNPSKFGQITYCQKLQDYLPSSAPPVLYRTDGKVGSSYFAASKVSNNERYVFISSTENIFRLVVDASGLHYDGFLPVSFFDPNISGDIDCRGEMELIELNDDSNVKYRLAIYFPYLSGVPSSNVVHIYNLDANGVFVNDNNGTDKYYLPYENNPQFPIEDRAYIHGLEFSPDGNVLYITHQTNSDYPSAFDYFDFNSPAAGIQSVPGITNQEKLNFEFSQIELAQDGSLYLAYSGGLARFQYPNTPNSGVLSLAAHPFAYSSNREGDANNRLPLKSYMLPDQIDGMDYSINAYPSIYNSSSQTAAISETWIPGDNPWNDTYSEISMQGDLIIPTGRNVVIDGMILHFAPETKVIIEQGAKLTLDKTTFTNGKVACDNSKADYWQGIQVYGTTNQHQAPNHNPTYQGMLELKNGGTIEYAHKAATNWNEGSWSEIGGVIKSTDGVFRNNRRGVEFMEYQNFHPATGSFRVNISSFTDTEFLTDDNFIEGYPQQPYVTLWKVHGINFENCHFANNVTTNKSLSSSPNEGISTLDASFKVVPRCDSPPLPYGTPCPTGLLMKSSFEGLEYAIQVAGAGGSEAVTISQTDFTNNIWGVRVKEFDNVNINRNDFVIGNGGYNNSTYSGNGIFLDNSVEYIVEENSVLNTLSSGKTSGIVVDYGGPLDNKVYKNTLSNLFEGTKSNRVNRSVDLKYGLQFLCNDYLNNENAIVINSSDNSHGVRLNQGDFYSQTSSGNTFQFNTLDIADYANQINYYHSGGITSPNMTNGVVGPVQEILVNNKNACPTSFKPGVVMFHELLTKLNDYETELVNHKAAYNILNYNYISLIDNGDTDILQGQIENNWSSDAWTLRNNLMQESPYLSTEALLTAAGENVLPNAMLLEVLLANPDATRGEDFITELNDVTDNALPEYMLNYVRNNWDTETVRTTLEGEMMYYKSKIATATNFVKYLEKSKDEHTYVERHNTVLRGEGISNKIGLMDFFVENSEWSRADSVLQDIQNDETLQSSLDMIEDFDNYITFRSSLGERNIAQLDSTEVQYLETLAEKGSRASGYAENILCFFYDICYEKEIPEGAPMAKMLTIPTPSADDPSLEELMYNITVYPNPANDFTSIKWEIYDELNNSHYKIFDLNGREMGSGAIEKNEGEKVIDTRSLTNGVYIINIYNDGIMKMNSKLIVNKEK